MKILYFYRGQPTEQEMNDAQKSGAVLRDARAWHQGDFVEQCDAASGRPENVPAPYRKFPYRKPEFMDAVEPPEKKKRKKNMEIEKHGSDS